MKITEAFAKKLAISEKVYANEHGGRAMSEANKIAVARVLANTSEYLNEAFESSVGTQLSNMKTFKKFCLDLTTVALPNLIANDLVIVYPMKSRTGYIQYLQFTAGSNKGGVKQGDVLNDVFRLGDMTDSRVNYSAATVTLPVAEDATEAAIAWTPVIKSARKINDVVTEAEVWGIKADGTAEALTIVDGKVTFTAGEYTQVTYQYDNIVIPQNDIPQVTAHMEGIELTAKARRLGIYYSQMAAFQAKTEMGIDLGEVLATQACAELSYEIDCEVVNMLINNAEEFDDLIFSRTLPIGVSMRDHYISFAEKIAKASQHIYDKTKKHAGNFILCASDVITMFGLMDGAWKPASNANINGPYFAGTLNGLKVYVSPTIPAGKYVVGYNGNDMTTSAAVYAPYMAVVPTQLLGFADGSMSQGFSTLYDLKMLNPMLLAAGKVTA